MKHLFVTRPGETDGGDGLVEFGFEQMKRLGEQIRIFSGGGSVRLISSSAPCAVESSEALMVQLGLEGFEQSPYIWPNRGLPRPNYYWDYITDRLPRLMEIVKEKGGGVDSLVVVTHPDVLFEFPNYFYREEFRGKGEIERGILTGQAFYFDLVHKEYRVISGRGDSIT